MNSIDQRLKRLQQVSQPTRTRKGDRLEKTKQQMLIEQKGCCKCCGWIFGRGEDKPRFDFPTKRFDYPLALLCARCERIVDACGRDVVTLNKVINYLSGDVKNQELFNTQPLNPVQQSGKYFEITKPTSWDEVK